MQRLHCVLPSLPSWVLGWLLSSALEARNLCLNSPRGSGTIGNFAWARDAQSVFQLESARYYM